MKWSVFVFFVVGNALVTPLDKATIYVQSFGKVTYLPAACGPYCPDNKCIQCNLTTASDCLFTDLFRLEAPQGEHIIAGFYTVPPFQACQRDLITIDRAGSYRLTIDAYVNTTCRSGSRVHRLSVSETHVGVSYVISVDFVLGFLFQ